MAYEGSESTTPIILNLGTGFKWLVSRPNRFSSGEESPVPTEQEARVLPEQPWTLGRKRKLSFPARNRTTIP